MKAHFSFVLAPFINLMRYLASRGSLLRLCLSFALSFAFSVSVLAQKREKDRNKLATETFEPIAKSSAIQCPTLIFPNVGYLDYYQNPSLYMQITKLKRENDHLNLQKALHQYVSNFGIQNFLQESHLIWLYAETALVNKDSTLAKELFRLALKHHRGDKVRLSKAYDSLTFREKIVYVPLEKYYNFIDRWQLVDSLRPPEDLGSPIGGAINSPFEDYGLSMGENDSVIYFTSKRLVEDTTDIVKKINMKFDENLYRSVKIGEDYWSEPERLDVLNSTYSEGSPAVSPDGKAIVFARCEAQDGFGNCDLYISYKLDTAWSRPINMGKGINSYAWESHPSFSITGDTLYFASDRKGGFGGTDIYFTIRDKRNRWREAVNLGPIINTQFSELSPFIHKKEDLLYFSSNGHLNNFGGFDIFKAYKIAPNQWCEPKNLGPFVNTEGHEMYFTIDSESHLLFYAKAAKKNLDPKTEEIVSEKRKYENFDLFSFQLPMEAQARAIVRFTGRVTEAYTGEVFEGMVVVFDLEEKTPIAPRELREDGTFEFELIDKRKYLLIVSGENFFRIEEIFELHGDTHKDLEAKRATAAASSDGTQIETIQFKSIEFQTASARILPSMENDLHLIIDFLVEHPNSRLEIRGHTDATGKAEENLKLSQERADAIRDYILSYGRIEENRIKAIGLGATQPLVWPEVTEEDRRTNRRVEFKISLHEEG
jgi:flagellar motor protein MotB